MSKTESTALTVSVIIPTRNEEQVISECLAAVFNQSIKPSEVIVVDGRSTDKTKEIASGFPVKILVESEPSSLPNARNLGADNAQSDILFIMDADIVLDRDCLKNALEYFKDSKTIAVIPSERNVPHSKLEKLQIDYFRGSANPIRTGIGISVFAEFLRKEVFSNIHFDPHLGYGEDGDFQRKLLELCGQRSGKIIRASDSLISVHYSHTLAELCSQYAWYGRTFKMYIKRNFLIKPLLNLASLLLPTLVIITGLLSLALNIIFPLFVLLFALLIIRSLIVSIRSRTLSFFGFLGFEFIRSLLFAKGLFQGMFSTKRGR